MGTHPITALPEGFVPYSYTKQRLQGYDGVEVIVSNHALKETSERLFPASKHRSKRVHKKLVKRFGGEFYQVPCIWNMGGKIVMHPDCYAAFRKKMARRQEEQFMRDIYGDFYHPTQQEAKP